MQEEPRKRSFLDAEAMGRVDDVRGQYQVVVDEVGRENGLRYDAAHGAGSQEHDLRSRVGEP